MIKVVLSVGISISAFEIIMSVAKAEIRITILRVYGIDAQDFVLRWGSGLLDGHISFELDLLIALRRVVWHAAIAFG